MPSHLDYRTWAGEYIIYGEFLQECCILDLIPYWNVLGPPPPQKTDPIFLKINFNVLTVFIILCKSQSLICTMIKAFYVKNLLVGSWKQPGSSCQGLDFIFTLSIVFCCKIHMDDSSFFFPFFFSLGIMCSLKLHNVEPP